MTTKIPGTKLVRASALPPTFKVPTTFHRGGTCTAARVGCKVRVTFLGHSVLLPLTARVRVVTVSLSQPIVRKAA